MQNSLGLGPEEFNAKSLECLNEPKAARRLDAVGSSEFAWTRRTLSASNRALLQARQEFDAFVHLLCSFMPRSCYIISRDPGSSQLDDEFSQNAINRDWNTHAAISCQAVDLLAVIKGFLFQYTLHLVTAHVQNACNDGQISDLFDPSDDPLKVQIKDGTNELKLCFLQRWGIMLGGVVQIVTLYWLWNRVGALILEKYLYNGILVTACFSNADQGLVRARDNGQMERSACSLWEYIKREKTICTPCNLGVRYQLFKLRNGRKYQWLRILWFFCGRDMLFFELTVLPYCWSQVGERFSLTLSSSKQSFNRIPRFVAFSRLIKFKTPDLSGLMIFQSLRAVDRVYIFQFDDLKSGGKSAIGIGSRRIMPVITCKSLI